MLNCYILLYKEIIMKFFLNENFVLKYDFDKSDNDFEYSINEYDAYYDLVDRIGKTKIMKTLNDYIDFVFDPRYDEDDQLQELFADHMDLFNDELKAIYYDEAKEEFEDNKLDDYDRVGMKRSDF